MIQMTTAYTTEIDEPEKGIDEILEQLNLKSLKKHSAGVLACHFDFIDEGFVAELSKRLPFDFIGMTTIANATAQGHSMYGLSMAVLTSDEVSFSTVLTEPLGSADYGEKIAGAWASARGQLPGDPSLLMTIIPYLKYLSGSIMLESLDDVCGGIPIWGGAATSVDVGDTQCCVVRNGVASPAGLAMLLLQGSVNPEFVFTAIPRQKIRESVGVITESDGCLLKKINNQPAWKYLENIGINLVKQSSTSMPFMVYYEGNAEPVSLGVYTINEDGSLLCGGPMPEGARITTGEITVEGIISTGEESVRRILQSNRHGGAFLFPCVTRYVMLAPNQGDEMKLVAKMTGGSGENKVPHLMSYCGGEICPVRDENGKLHNRMHNYSFSACVF
ncbi:MAG: FIST C-terminal domain-containing protein [Synergistaceae bacterium]|jgi:hypothetical protein|nr:FIST C-terminal domain-containing protein [Synergistaceae bacterium]